MLSARRAANLCGSLAGLGNDMRVPPVQPLANIHAAIHIGSAVLGRKAASTSICWSLRKVRQGGLAYDRRSPADGREAPFRLADRYACGCIVRGTAEPVAVGVYRQSAGHQLAAAHPAQQYRE